MPEYPIEPFRIKSVEHIEIPGPEERDRLLKEAHYNLFKIPAEKVFVDLLTDSGTGAMSQEQWSALMLGDESYASAKSWYRFERAVQEFTGMPHVIPVHQGRGGERIIASVLLRQGDIVISNTLFDTTRANIEAVGAEGVDIPCPQSADIKSDYPFKGNIDTDRLTDIIRKDGPRVKMLVLTLTNNTGGGQPVSVENVVEAARIARKNRVLVMLDICRVAENAYLVKQRDPSRANRSVAEIVKEIISHADLVSMSAKKDAIANIGGFIATRDEDLAQRFRAQLILWEGFPTYGGMPGRDMDAIAQGLREGVNESYLSYRIGQVRYLAERLREIGYPVMWPPGGHAVYIEAGELLPHIPKAQFPGQALSVELYREGAVRTVEIGSLMFGPEAKHEFVRLAIPRRVYTKAHLDWVAEAAKRVYDKRKDIRGYRIVWEPKALRHFLCELEPVR
ncbi:MAG: tryptophanase [candidate division WOR-3 bacterium]